MKTEPPPGYRLLLAGEIIDRGDLCFWHSRWEPCRSTIGSGYDPHWHDTTARKVASASAEKPCTAKAGAQ